MDSAESSDAIVSSDKSRRKDPTKQSSLQDGSTIPTPQAPSHDLSSEHTYSVVPHNQQEVEPTTLSSPPPTATDGCHPADTQDTVPSALAGPGPTEALHKSASAPAESTVSEGQGVSRTNAPPPANHPQTSPSYLTPLPALPELPPLGQQNTEPTSFGSVTIDPSLLSEPVDGLPPATDFEPGLPALPKLPPFDKQNREPRSLPMIEPSLQLNPVDNLPPDTDPEPDRVITRRWRHQKDPKPMYFDCVFKMY